MAERRVMFDGGRGRRTLSSWASAIVFGLVLSLGIAGVAAPASATEPVTDTPLSGITVTSTGSTVLAGGDGRVSVTAANPNGVDLYNATGVVVLPVGVTYVPGSAQPGPPNAVGEPTILTWIPDPNDPDPDNPYTAQVLVWENISDLPVDSDADFSFAVTADNARYPVGSTFDVGIGVYANNDERIVPTVTIPDDGGAPVVDDATEGDSSDSEMTVVALEIEKSETANPEGEVYRGAANPATFSLTVRTAEAAGSTGVVVTDLIPATFTFDGFTSEPCTTTPAACASEVVVVDGEVFTKLTWTLGDLTAAASRVLTYDAHVGLREVAADGTPTGPATRPAGAGTPVTNTATLQATYGGSVVEGGSTTVEIDTEATVTVLDVGIVKSGPADEFVAGQEGTYRLDVRTSEYIDATGVTITDVVPDGMCPVIPTGVATPADWPSDCPTGGEVSSSGITVTAVDYDAATGRSTITFAVADRTPDQDAWIEYPVYMRAAYHDGTPTGTGDSFTNTAEVTGTTTPAEGNTVDTGDVAVENGSSATIGTSQVTLNKSMSVNADRTTLTGVTGAGETCQNQTDYASPDAASSPAYQLGDLVCFRIEADFPTGVATRDAIVTDFLPSGTALVDWAAGPGSTLSDTDTPATITQLGTATRWQLGARVSGSGPYYVAAGSTLVLDLLVRVTSVPATTPKVTGNLAKMRYLSGDGQVVPLRDDVDFRLAPSPSVSLDKSHGVAGTRIVEEGETVPFTLTVAHDGTPEKLNDYPLETMQVWDVLPAGFTCAAVSGAVPAADSCVQNSSGRWVVTWDLDTSDFGVGGLVPGTPFTISYDLTVPTPLSIGSSHTNTAAVTRFTAVTTDGITPNATGSVFFPTNPVGAFPNRTKNAAEASDTATIALAGASVDKSVYSTGIDDTGDDALTQATIGEAVVWEYSVTIPARTSVFSGVLDDALPTSAALVQTGAPTVTAPGGVTIVDVSGANCTNDTTVFRLCDDGRLFFPATYTNAAATPATFTVHLPTRVADVGANVHGRTITNTATLRSAMTSGGTVVDQAQDAAQVTVVEPSPDLTKSGTPLPVGSTIGAGTTIQYTLSLSNAAGRSPLYASTIVDCVPAGLAVAALGAGMTTGGSGCAAGTTAITWTPTSPILGGTSQSVTYTVTVVDTVAAGQSFTNTATLAASSAPAGTTGARAYGDTASATLAAVKPTVTKTRTSAATVVPGGTTTWSVVVSIPAGITLYDAAIVDTLPAQFTSTAVPGTGSLVTPVGIVCGGGDADWQTDCVPTTALTSNTPSTGTPLTTRNRDWGISVGTIEAAPTARTITLALQTVLPVDTAATTNTTATNTAALRWNWTDTTTPTTTAQAAALNDSATGSATVSVRHPAVTVAKTATDTTPEQGQVFSYTVTGTATAGSNNVTAYDVTIVDTVPAGIVVTDAAGTPIADGASTASGGVWNAAARTLTWTIPSIAVGTPVTRAYYATLAPAAQLTGGALTNSVRATQWSSLSGGGRTYGPSAAATRPVTPQFPKIDAAKTQVSPANPVRIDQEVTYRFTLTNSGGAVATALDGVDTLPSGWTYVAGSATVQVRTGTATAVEPAVSTSALVQTLTWASIGGASVNLLPGETITVVYRATPTADVPTIGTSVAQTNTVTAARVTDATGGTSYNGGAGSYVGTTGSASATIALTDMQITKSAGTFTAGGTGTFTLTVKNNGPDAASGISVREDLDLPAGVTFTSAVGTGWTCGAPDADGVFTCTRTDATATVASGTTLPVITVTVAIGAGVTSGTTVPNTATVSSTTADRTPGNDTATASGSVITRADLAVTKTDSPDPVVAGQTLTWTITLRNNGPSVSRGTELTPIVLRDTLPTSVTGVSIVSGPTECQIASGALTCSFAHDFAVGDSVQVVLTGTVASTIAPGSTITNTATVTPVTTDPTAGNNSATANTTTSVQESLTVDKSIVQPDPPVLVPGETAVYEISVTNGGPSAARGVYVTDTLPAGLTYTSGSLQSVAGTWTVTAPAAGQLRFALSGDLAVGATVTLRYTVDVATGATDPDALENTAVVSSTWRANQDTAVASPGEIAPSADLVLDKSVSPTTVSAGQTATYTLTTDNAGPSDAAGPVTLTDTLPTGLSVSGALPSGCTQSGQTITCVKSDGLDAAETPWSVQITVLVAASFLGTTIDNTASVSSPTTDPTSTNNVDDAELTVDQRAHLTVTKTPSAAVVTAGDELAWTITVANSGPSDAQSVSLSDTIDENLVLTAAASETAGVSCTVVGTTDLECSLGTVPAGGSVVVTLTTTVRSSVPDATVIPNAATATSTTWDTVTGEPATATGSGQIEIDAVSALTIEKSTSTPVVDAGEPAVFDILVGNDGLSDAATVVTVVDELPDGLTFESASTEGGPAQWSCTADGQTVTCELQDAEGDPVTLPAGSDAPTLHIVAIVSADLAAGTVTNTATASSPSAPEDPSDDADVEVVTHADLGLTKTHTGTATAGLPFTWTLTITNGGPSDSVATAADPITVTDTLPAGVTLAASPTSGGTDTTCTATGTDDDGRQIVECDRTSTIAAGDSVVLTLHVDIDQAVSGEIVNTAEVAPGLTSEPDEPTLLNDATDTVTVTEIADLTIAKTVTTATPTAGAELVWQVTVTNAGPSGSDASEEHPITVTDTLPAGVTYVSAVGDDWSCTSDEDGLTFTCERTTDLPVGDAPSITVTGLVAPDVQGTVTNRVEVAPGETAQPSEGLPDVAEVDADITESADLVLAKGISEEVVAGATGRYLLTVTNDGPSTARGISLVDTLPDGLSFVRVVPPGTGTSPWSCAAAEDDPQLVECLYSGTIAPDAVVTLEIEVAAEAPLSGEVTNSADVMSTTPDPDLDNNHAEVDGTLVTVADLQIAKAHDQDVAAVAGTPFAWTVTVSNDGPSDSVATADAPILVEDVLPAGVTLSEDETSGDGTTVCLATGTDADGRQVVTCEIAQTIAAGDDVVLTLNVVLDQTLSGTVTNVVTVTPELTPDPVQPNTATDAVPIVEIADLTIAKSVTTAEPVAGEQIQWAVTVTNAGPSDSDADEDDPITVVDTLPAGVSFVEASGEGWSCAAIDPDEDDRERFSCARTTDLAVGDAPVIEVTGLVAPDVQGTIRNTAEVAPGLTDQPEIGGLPDTATADADVAEFADLSLDKQIDTEVVAGATGRYALTVANDGPSTARGITITDTLPDGLAYGAIVDSDGWSCTPDEDDAQSVSCAYDGTLEPGDELVLVIEVTADAALSGDIVNAAVVGATTPDPDPENNDDEVNATVVTEADLGIVKSHRGIAVAGTPFAWTLTVTNHGPSDSVATADDPILVQDVLPAGVTLAAEPVSGDADTACVVVDTDEDGREVVECEIAATIPAGDEVVLTLNVDLDESLEGTLPNTATVEPGATPEPEDATHPNESTDEVVLGEVADLTIAKRIDTDPVVAGSAVQWTVTVSNRGPSNSDADEDDPITVVDTLPAGVAYETAAGDGWTCVRGDDTEDGRQSVVCDRSDDLLIGEAPEITVTGTVDPSRQGEITNQATVSPGLTAQPEDGETDQASVTAPVTESADLALSKAISQTLTAGATGRYLLDVTNLGPSTARGIVVTDTLPAGLTFASIVVAEGQSSPWTCVPDADTPADLVCAFTGDLLPGDTARVEIEVAVDQTLQGDVVNTAVVTATTPDPVTENNVAEVPGTLAELADLSVVKTAGGDPVVGGELDYTIVVSNAGPSTARGVVVSDLVPAGLQVVSAVGEGWTCTVSTDSGAITCVLAELAAGRSAAPITVTTTVLPGAYPQVSNTATVTATTPEDEATLGDNTSTAITDIPALSALSIQKQLDGDLVTGAVAQYTITVRNEGPTDDPGAIVVTDRLPVGLNPTGSWSVDGAEGSCTADGRTVTCTLDALAVGQEATIVLTVTVAADARGTLVNTATVTSPADPEGAAASADGIVTVSGLANTGGGIAELAPLGAALLLLGAAGVWLARRRRVAS